MTAGDVYRDVGVSGPPQSRDARQGREYVAVIGIDRYLAWNRLYNAVSDAQGAVRLFTGLGFQLVGPPLFDEAASGDALRRLVIDDLSGLGGDDSLILFFAGHGHTITRVYDGDTVRDGYLIPADGDLPGGRTATWIRLDTWLTEIARIPAKHILVILDACHSGLALSPVLPWRSRGTENARREPLEQLRARRSRRIITSALDDQLAMDGGPVPGHSLFTGCLIEAMTGGLVASSGHRIVTGSEIGHYVQRRVSEYPGSTQTPDFGALELDDRGELVVRIGGIDGAQATEPTVERTSPKTRLNAPGSAPSDAVVGPAAPAREPPAACARPSPPRRRARALSIGAAAVIAVVVGAAVLLASRDRAPTGNASSTPGGPDPAGTAVVTPPDSALGDAAAGAAPPEPQDAAVEPEPRKTVTKHLQQSSTRGDDANAPVPDRPAIDDRGN